MPTFSGISPVAPAPEAAPPAAPSGAASASESDLMASLIALGSDTGVAMELIASMPPNLGNNTDVRA